MNTIKLRLFAIALCMFVVLSGCANKIGTTPVSTGTASGTTVPTPSAGLTAEDVELPADGWSLPEVSYTDFGTFGAGGFYDAVDFVLTFTDISNGTNVVLCSKPGCLHYDASESVKKDCDAYVGITVSMHYLDGKIYYVGYVRGSDDRSSLWLQRRNADGTGYEKIGQLAAEYITKDTSVSVSQFIFAGNMLYYRADVEKLVKTEGVSTSVLSACHLMRIELDSGKDELLVEHKQTETPLIIAAREDMLLYYTIPKLTEEETADSDLRFEKPSKLCVWVDSVKQSITLYSDKYKVFRGRGSVLGSKYYYPYYDNPGTGESRYKAYDLVTRQHEDTDLVALPEINERYAVRLDETTNKSYLYDVNSETSLPMEYENVRMRALKSNEKGVILSIDQYEDGNPTPIHSEKRYILYSELEDGLQKIDGIIMPFM